ncbi:MAG: FkbM family methyltransferase [Microcystaceae cyanobacterium]
MKIFIDGGTNLFQGLTQFHGQFHFDSTWQIYCFEANPETYQMALKRIPSWLQPLNFQVLNQALADQAGTVTVNCASADDSCMQYYDGVLWKNLARRGVGKIRRLMGISPHTNQGSNILEKPPERHGDHIFRYKPYTVEAIDLGALVESFAPQQPEKLIIKLDIEGAEFQVLDRLFQSPGIHLISEMYVEFHERYFQEKEEAYRQKKLGYFQQAANLNSLMLQEWH